MSTLFIDRELGALDLFLKEFLGILEKHSRYPVVSGYVSIVTGRSRATEDIDVLVPVMNKENFRKLFDDLVLHEFWCYQGKEIDEIYFYMEKMTSIRFAKKETMFPNIGNSTGCL
jgi:hypothetical protein